MSEHATTGRAATPSAEWHADAAHADGMVDLLDLPAGDGTVPLVARFSAFDPTVRVTRATPGTDACEDPANWFAGHDHLDALVFLTGSGAAAADSAFHEVRDEESVIRTWDAVMRANRIAAGRGDPAEAEAIDLLVLRSFRAVPRDEEGNPSNVPTLRLEATARFYVHHRGRAPDRAARIRRLMEEAMPAARAQAAALASGPPAR